LHGTERGTTGLKSVRRRSLIGLSNKGVTTMLKEIFTAAKKGWISGGVKWREEFVAKDIDPDKFLALPNNQGIEMLQKYLLCTPQSKIQFLNMTVRSNLFKFIKID